MHLASRNLQGAEECPDKRIVRVALMQRIILGSKKSSGKGLEWGFWQCRERFCPDKAGASAADAFLEILLRNTFGKRGVEQAEVE